MTKKVFTEKITIEEPTIIYGRVVTVGNAKGIVIPKNTLKFEGWDVGTELKVYLRELKIKE